VRVLIAVAMAGLMTVAGVRGDTVFLRSNVSYNGTITGQKGKSLVLHAQFSVGAKDMEFPFNDISRIEYNDNTVNNGSPPTALGGHPPSESSRGLHVPTPADSAGKDVVVLNDGTTVPCTVSSVTREGVTCGNTTYSHDRIYRVYFHGQ
jgi:hypothetical protein